MPEKAGFEITADLKSLRKELRSATDEFRKFNADALKAATGVKPLESAADQVGQKLRGATVVTQAFGAALGFLGANSITNLLFKLKQFVVDSLHFGVVLDGVQARAKAMFGDALPQVTKEIQRLSIELKRSDSNLLETATGFASLLDSVGASSRQVADFSVQLSELAVVLGKAFPDKTDEEIAQKLQAGILGNVRGLRELGIVMKDKLLQDFADRKGIKLKIAAMTEEQKIVLRTQFLLEQTTKLQQAAAESTGKLGDTAKTAKDAWQDLKEVAGQGLGPAFSAGILVAIQLAQNLVNVLVTAASVIRQVGLGLRGVKPGEIDALSAGTELNIQNQAALNAAMERRRLTGTGAKPVDETNDFWSPKGAAGGGGSAVDAAQERAKAEKEVLDALSEEAKQNLDKLRATREDLLLRKELGVLTRSESEELRRINNRLEFKGELLDDLKTKWQDLQDEMRESSDRLKDLRQELKDLEKDGSADRLDKIVELVRERNDIRKATEGSSELTGDQSRRLGEIDAELAGSSQADVAEGERRAGMTPLALAAEEEKQKRSEIIQQIEQERAKMDSLKEKSREAQQAIVDALKDREAQTKTINKLIEAETKRHVEAEIAELNKLERKYRSVGISPSVTVPDPSRSGSVTTTNNQTINVSQSNYGSAAEVAADARGIRWTLRKYS